MFIHKMMKRTMGYFKSRSHNKINECMTRNTFFKQIKTDVKKRAYYIKKVINSI